MRLCTICARGGSKGVPGKNIRPLLGLPLIAHSIAHAKASKLFAAVAVSSDSDEILAVAKKHGADMLIKRPDALANDAAAKAPAIAHAVREAEAMTGQRYDVNVDLDATAPLRLLEDIVGAVKLLEDTKCSNVITGGRAHCSPYFSMVECDENGVARLSKTLPKPIVRRQDSPACYDMNGSIWVWNRDTFLSDPKIFYPDTRLYIMPRERSIDIDDELDFIMVETLLKHRQAA